MTPQERFENDRRQVLESTINGFTYKTKEISQLHGFKGARFTSWDAAKAYVERLLFTLIEDGLVGVDYHEKDSTTFTANRKGREYVSERKPTCASQVVTRPSKTRTA